MKRPAKVRMYEDYMGTCLRCGKTGKILCYEVHRRSGVRCVDCGGPMELSQEAKDRLAAVATAQARSLERYMGLTKSKESS